MGIELNEIHDRDKIVVNDRNEIRQLYQQNTIIAGRGTEIAVDLAHTANEYRKFTQHMFGMDTASGRDHLHFDSTYRISE